MSGEKQLITADDLKKLSEAQGYFEDLEIVGQIDLSQIQRELHFKNCQFEWADVACNSLEHCLVFINCVFLESVFFAGYFLRGAYFIGCTFQGGTDFGCGGHNKAPHEFRIENCIFQEFVSFSDCWFEGPVTIIGNHFHKGTDLLGDKGTPVEVSFDVPPVIEGNIGKLDMSSYETRWK